MCTVNMGNWYLGYTIIHTTDTNHLACLQLPACLASKYAPNNCQTIRLYYILIIYKKN